MASDRSVLLGSQSISRFVTALPDITLQAGDYGQVTTNPLPSLTGDDSRGFWSTRNPWSPFHGATRLADYPISVASGGVTIFAGALYGISSDGNQAAVTLRTVLQGTLEAGLVYVTGATPKDPATVALEILALYKVPVDSASFARAISLYTANAVTVSVSQLAPSGTILAALEALAQVGVARIYEVAGRVYFDAWQPRTAPPLVTLTDRQPGPCTLWSRPQVATQPKDRCDGYVVEWVGSPTATRGLVSQSRRTISAGAGSVAALTTLQGAVWVGEQWYAYLNTPQDVVTLRIPAFIGKSLQLGMAIGIDYTQWANPITIDITSIDTSDDTFTTIVGLTR